MLFGEIKSEFRKNELFVSKETSGILEKDQVDQTQKYFLTAVRQYGDDFTDPELYPGGENERYLEIWNLVFSEFNHNPDHTYTPLPNKNIDTGLGLERMASIIQDVPTNYDTDLFMPIIKAVEDVSGEKYGVDAEQRCSI